MANQYVNKVEADGSTLIDLTSDTVEPSALAAGYTAHDRSGAPITGTFVQEQSDWEVYDSTDPAYIRNRPFYHDYDVTSVLAATTFGPNWADYDVSIGGTTYALMSEGVSLLSDIAAGEDYRVNVSGTDYSITAGQSTSYTLIGAGSSTKTVTGIPLVVAGKCVLVRTGAKSMTVLLAGTAGQYQVPSKTIIIDQVGADELVQIDPEFLPAATASAYGAVKVDTAISASSANPVQNQAVKAALDDLQNAVLNAQALLQALGTIPVANGGTGATTAADARTNLGITPANIGAAPTSHNHSGHALTPASVTASGAIQGSSISDGTGTLAQLRESVSKALSGNTITLYFFGVVTSSSQDIIAYVPFNVTSGATIEIVGDGTATFRYGNGTVSDLALPKNKLIYASYMAFNVLMFRWSLGSSIGATNNSPVVGSLTIPLRISY